MFARLKDDIEPSENLRRELAAYIGNTIGPIAVPDEIYFVTKLPKTRSGKVMRRVLRAVAENVSLGDLTSLEDENSVEEVIKVYQELKQAQGKEK
jgi:acetyl-CoA synthetase